MKKIIALVAAGVAALTFAASALAWHSDGVAVSAICNQETHTYDVSATIQQSSGYPGATIKSITPSSFPGTTSGTKAVVVVIKWPNSNDTQTWTKTVTLAGTCVQPPPPPPTCPEGYHQQGESTNPLLCLKETVTEHETRVEVPVEVIKEVPGPTQYVTQYVDKVVTVEKAVPGPTVVKTVVKWKTKIVNHKVVKVKVVTRVIYKVKVVTKTKKVVGICKVPGGGIGVEGSG